MPDTLPCPFCKSPIAAASADARGKAICGMCLHEFLLRGQRLTDWVDPDDEALAQPIYDDAEVIAAESPPSPTPRTDPPRRRRRDSWSGDNVRRNPPKKHLWIIVGLPLAVIFAIIGIVMIGEVAWRPPAQREFQKKVVFDANAEAFVRPPAFFANEPLTEESIRRELPQFFATYRQALRRALHPDITAHVNAQRIHDEFVKLGGVTRPGAEFQNVAALETFVVERLVEHAKLFDFDEFRFLDVRKLSDTDAQVTMRRWQNGDLHYQRTRFWLTRTDGIWRIYDFEDMPGNFRYLTFLAEYGIGEPPNLTRRLDILHSAVNALPQNLAGAEKHLQDLGPEPLPARYECLRHLTKSEVLLRLSNKPREALDELAKCRQFDPDKPRIHYLEAYARNDIREFAKALACVDRYRKALEDDSEISYEAALALRGLNRFPEAAVQIRKSLDYDPKNANTLLLLLQTLDVRDPRHDIGVRFTNLDVPANHFELLAQDRLKAKDWKSLDILAKTLANLDPSSLAPDCYLALADLNQNKTKQALDRIKNALARENDEHMKNVYWERFVGNMVALGKAHDAYKLAPDPKVAFRLVGGELQKSYRTAELRRLIAVHQKTHPDDALIPLFQGFNCALNGEYEKAETLFAAAIDKRADGFLVDQTQFQRVMTRYRLGKGMSAYEEIALKDAAFTQLAQLAWDDRNGPLLEEFVEAQEAVNPAHPLLGRGRWRARLLAKKEADAVLVFKANLDAVRDKDQRRFAIEDFTHDCLDADLAMLAYRSSPEPRLTFERIASDCLTRGKRDTLIALIAVHAAKFPADPFVDLYRGQMHLDDREWEPAADALAKAWKNAKMDEKYRLQFAYNFALVKGGRALQAHKEAADQNKAFVEFGRQIIVQDDFANLDRLILQHRPSKKNDPETLMIYAHAKIAVKNANGAAALLKLALANQSADALRRVSIAEFVGRLAEKGLALDAYRLVDDKSAAFESLALHLAARKQFSVLGTLVDEHAKTHPGDPSLFRYRGDVAFDRGDIAKAEAAYRAGAEIVHANQWFCKFGLERTRVKAGKALALYREMADDASAFFNIADDCVRANDIGQLEAVVDAHRKNDPDDPLLLRFDIEMLVLKKDNAGVAALCVEAANGPRKLMDDHFLNDRRVRALVHVKKLDEAQLVAEAATKKRQGDRMLPALVAAASGDVDKTLAAFATARPMDFDLQRYYQDADLGPLLRGDALRRVRDRYPEPPRPAFNVGQFRNEFFGP